MKKFKLVPLKHFENLMNGKQMHYEEEKNDPHIDKKINNDRTLKDVIDQDEGKINVPELSPSFQYVTDIATDMYPIYQNIPAGEI